VVVAKVREGLAVSKRATQKFYMGRFNLKKLNEAEVKNSIRLISQTGLQLWETSIMMWISIEHGKQNIKISAKEHLDYYKLRKHKPWFNKGFSKLSDQNNMPNCNGYRIQAK
jgi:hypothetical protein